MIYKETERMITCVRADGKPVRVPAEKLVLRPAAYAILPHQGRILLVGTSHTDKYLLPGGRVRLGESVEAALRRKLVEETGVEVDIRQFCGFREHFFFDESIHQAFHGLLFYYLCALRSQQTIPPQEKSHVTPQWVEISSLRPEEFQHSGRFVMDVLHREDRPAGAVPE